MTAMAQTPSLCAPRSLPVTKKTTFASIVGDTELLSLDSRKNENSSANSLSYSSQVHSNHERKNQDRKHLDKKNLNQERKLQERKSTTNENIVTSFPVQNRKSGKVFVRGGHHMRGGGHQSPLVCYECGQGGHKSTECSRRKISKESGNLIDITCHRCYEPGHKAPDCPHRTSSSRSKEKDTRKTLCIYWEAGNCRFGESCDYLHMPSQFIDGRVQTIYASPHPLQPHLASSYNYYPSSVSYPSSAPYYETYPSYYLNPEYMNMQQIPNCYTPSTYSYQIPSSQSSHLPMHYAYHHEIPPPLNESSQNLMELSQTQLESMQHQEESTQLYVEAHKNHMESPKHQEELPKHQEQLTEHHEQLTEHQEELTQSYVESTNDTNIHHIKNQSKKTFYYEETSQDEYVETQQKTTLKSTCNLVVEEKPVDSTLPCTHSSSNYTSSSITVTSEQHFDFTSTSEISSPTNEVKQEQRNSPSIVKKGLSNTTGENNCFINVVIQALFHSESFQKEFNQVTEHQCEGELRCLFCRLKEVFHGLSQHESCLVSPESIRLVLSSVFSDRARFEIGSMDDAAEAHDNMLWMLHKCLSQETISCSAENTRQGLACAVHKVFGLFIQEKVVCKKCKQETKSLNYDAVILYASTGLLKELKMQSPNISFDDLLKQLLVGDPYKCGNQECLNPSLLIATRSLHVNPSVFTLGLSWPSAQPTYEFLELILETISPKLDLSKVFEDFPNNIESTLNGIFCYYGRHYLAFFKDKKSKKWLSFDDDHVEVVGDNWEAVKKQCIQGRFQPLLLFYEQNNLIVNKTPVFEMTFGDIIVSDDPNNYRIHPRAEEKEILIINEEKKNKKIQENNKNIQEKNKNIQEIRNKTKEEKTIIHKEEKRLHKEEKRLQKEEKNTQKEEKTINRDDKNKNKLEKNFNKEEKNKPIVEKIKINEEKDKIKEDKKHIKKEDKKLESDESKLVSSNSPPVVKKSNKTNGNQSSNPVSNPKQTPSNASVHRHRRNQKNNSKLSSSISTSSLTNNISTSTTSPHS